MSVEFEEESILRTAVVRMPKGMVGMVIKSGLANTESGANIVLVVCAAIILLISGFFFFSMLDAGEPSPPQPLPEPIVMTYSPYV